MVCDALGGLKNRRKKLDSLMFLSVMLASGAFSSWSDWSVTEVLCSEPYVIARWTMLMASIRSARQMLVMALLMQVLSLVISVSTMACSCVCRDASSAARSISMVAYNDLSASELAYLTTLPSGLLMVIVRGLACRLQSNNAPRALC